MFKGLEWQSAMQSLMHILHTTELHICDDDRCIVLESGLNRSALTYQRRKYLLSFGVTGDCEPKSAPT